MTESKSSSKLFMYGCIAFIALGLICCCGGAGLLAISPALLMGLVLDKEPLPVEVWEWSESDVEALEARLAEEMERDRTIALTGEELTQITLSGDEGELEAFRIDIDEQDRAVVDISISTEDPDPRYVNIHLVGDMTVENGWFTLLVVDDLTIGKFDLGQFIAGQDITDDANQSLAQQRVQDPTIGDTLDKIELLTIRDGKFELVLSEDAVEEMRAAGKFD